MRRREDLEDELQRHYGKQASQQERAKALFTHLIGAPSLTLRSSSLQGLHVHIAKSKRDALRVKASPAFTLISESNSTCCFFNQVRSCPTMSPA